MNELDFIRKKPEIFDEAMKNRGLQPCSHNILLLDEKRKKVLTTIQQKQQQAKSLAKNIGILKQQEKDTALLEEEAKCAFKEIEEIQKSFANDELQVFMSTLPNVLDSTTPIGASAADNQEILKHGTIKQFNFIPKAHQDLGKNLGILEFEQTVKMSGARFASIQGKLAKLSRVLINYMLDHHIKYYGYKEVHPPSLVRDNAMYNVGQLPKFSDESFQTTNGMRLIPTAEVPLTNMFADKMFNIAELPIRLTAHSECFRMEAGSSGKDLKGIFRQHQFGKVELVSAVAAENSSEELERMVKIPEEILQNLDIPYRRMLLCSGDVGFSSVKTYDIEVWLPSQNIYREISSCSNCRDFQARRMKAKYLLGKEKKFIHTLNGSSLAIGRMIIAIMENYQNSDGTISIPEVLRQDCGFNSID